MLKEFTTCREKNHVLSLSLILRKMVGGSKKVEEGISH